MKSNTPHKFLEIFGCGRVCQNADLRAENGKRARAGAVGLELSMFEDMPEQIKVLNHRGKNLTTKRAREKEI
jgi:hypothetical protein